MKKAKRMHRNLDILITELNKAETVNIYRSMSAIRKSIGNCAIFLIIELVILFVLIPDSQTGSSPFQLSFFLKESL